MEQEPQFDNNLLNMKVQIIKKTIWGEEFLSRKSEKEPC